MDDGDEKVRLSVSRAPNCLQASVAHVEGECRHRMWLDGRGKGPSLAQDWGAKSCEVRGNPDGTWWHPQPGGLMSSRWPPILTVMPGEAGESVRCVDGGGCGWGMGKASGEAGG